MANTSKVKVSGASNTVIFAVSPNSVSESRTANYDAWSLVHLPVDLYAYKNTSSRTWEISAQLISRSVDEANANSKILNTVRSWLQPDFGSTGAPPEILTFYAYDDPNINNVTCVLRSYSWNYPTEVDYVYLANHKMPIVATLGLSLMEVYTASEIQDKNGPWKITGFGTDIINNPGGYGIVNPDYTQPADPLVGSSPSPVTPTGDPLNLLDHSNQNVQQIITDQNTGLPTILPNLTIPNGFIHDPFGP